MITLKNIVSNNNYITCDAYIEDSDTPIMLELDIESKELSPYALPPEYDWCTSHITKAKDYLISLIGETSFLNEKRIMWY